MKVQVLLAERLDDRRTITELRKREFAAGQPSGWACSGRPSTNAPSQTSPATSPDDAVDIGRSADADVHMRLIVQCEALSIKCRELEALNSDMSTFVQTLNTALEDKAREIDGLKQDRKLSFAVGRLPGHLPGCRSCAARDALIADLREEVSDRAKDKEDRRKTQKLLEVSEAKCDNLQRELEQWCKTAELSGRQLLESESALTARNEQYTCLLDEVGAARKGFSDSEERLAAEQTRVKELQGKVRSLENDFAASQVLLNAKNAEIAELESVIEKEKRHGSFEIQLSLATEELDRERRGHIELREHIDKTNEVLRQKEEELRQAREQVSTLDKHADALAADVERLYTSLQVWRCLTARRVQLECVLACLSFVTKCTLAVLQAHKVEHAAELQKAQTKIAGLQHQLAFAQTQKDIVARRTRHSRKPPALTTSLEHCLPQPGVESANRLQAETGGSDEETLSTTRELLEFIQSLDAQYAPPSPSP